MITFVPLPLPALRALVAGDLATASAVAGHPLSEWILGERWLWEIRVRDIEANPAAEEWIARAAVVDGQVVGAGGFHGPPDDEGRVEVGYGVDPAYRRKGFAKAMLAELIRRAEGDPRVRLVRASIRPDNVASLATIAPFGFEKVGEQWDEVDGLEIVYERAV
ncbi:GNAT family N-acetyltransferase [Nucisporomicrobium flavum]|uniref:GNAT family N-acetyltransferase n=1 Tax=Nucisporomicrobium flavum TaxID=2785915 RepID=UPI0018F7BFAE|nr:GNAT family protein [Nucisporomicrobium flavum]